MGMVARLVQDSTVCNRTSTSRLAAASKRAFEQLTRSQLIVVLLYSVICYS
jgi:hypothetical protein